MKNIKNKEARQIIIIQIMPCFDTRTFSFVYIYIYINKYVKLV
jgi:hypothetical protein